MTAANPTPEQLAELSALVALARHEQHAGRLAEAAEAYRKIIALRPDIAEAHNDLGIVLGRSKASPTRPCHGLSKRSRCDRTMPTHAITWATCCSARAGSTKQRRITSSADSPAGFCRST